MIFTAFSMKREGNQCRRENGVSCREESEGYDITFATYLRYEV